MKNNNIWKTIVVLGCFTALLAGCGTKKQESVKSAPEYGKTITCIGVMPAGSTVDYDASLNYQDAQKLTKGLQSMDAMLRKELGGRSDIKFISKEFLLGLDNIDSAKPLELLRSAGNSLSCNTILETTLLRYSERVGGNYSIDTPASVSFKYRLVDTETGKVLCGGIFDETQQSVLENLAVFNKAMSRGFVWITADELLQEGIKEKFEACPYLGSE